MLRALKIDIFCTREARTNIRVIQKQTVRPEMPLIDINKLAAEALELFGRIDDWEIAGNYARRKLFSEVAELRRQGTITSEQEVQHYLKQLDHLIQTLTIPDSNRNQIDTRQEKPEAVSSNTPDIEALKNLVNNAFSAPTDGSLDRAEVLAKRAQNLVHEKIIRYDIGFFERRKLKKLMRHYISDQVKAIKQA